MAARLEFGRGLVEREAAFGQLRLCIGKGLFARSQGCLGLVDRPPALGQLGIGRRERLPFGFERRLGLGQLLPPCVELLRGVSLRFEVGLRQGDGVLAR